MPTSVQTHQHRRNNPKNILKRFKILHNKFLNNITKNLNVFDNDNDLVTIKIKYEYFLFKNINACR